MRPYSPKPIDKGNEYIFFSHNNIELNNLSGRKTPIKHTVRSHIRDGFKVSSYQRGQGNRLVSRSYTPIAKWRPPNTFTYTRQTINGKEYLLWENKPTETLAIRKAEELKKQNPKLMEGYKIRKGEYGRYQIYVKDRGPDMRDEHGRDFKTVGERISFFNKDKRVSGTVLGVREQYYLVLHKGNVYKVDRHSIFTQIGGALKMSSDRISKLAQEGISKMKNVDREKFKSVLSRLKSGTGEAIREAQRRKSEWDAGREERAERKREKTKMDIQRQREKLDKQREIAFQKKEIRQEKEELRKLKEEEKKFKREEFKRSTLGRGLSYIGGEAKKQLAKQKPKPKPRKKRKRKTTKKKNK